MARKSISRIFTALADSAPDRVVALFGEDTLTAFDLDRSSNRLARAYSSLGVTRDSLVTVALPNSLEMIAVCVAIWKCGATPQPVSTGLDAAERAEIEGLVVPSLVVGVASSSARVPWVPVGWSTGADLAGFSDDPLPDAWASSWKAPTSSGSTGRPKVVLAAGPALLDPDRPVASYLPHDQVQLVAGPLTHSATFTYAFRGLMTGHRLVILPRFDERAVLAAIAEHRVTWALLVPTMLHRLLRLPAAVREAADVSSLTTVLHLGAPCPPETKRAFMAWVGPEHVVEVYAGSESNGIVSITGGEWLEHPGSVGRPSGATAVSIRRSDGSEAPNGETGEIWMRREGDPTYTYLGGTSARTPDGWDTIGDLGRLDAEGYLYVVDRSDDVILRGGVNVHPVEIERVVEAHPGVRSAVAFGVPDVDLGERIEVVADTGSVTVTEADLLDWCRSRLDGGRRPAAVHLVDEPVRDDAGKVRRSAYRARFATLSPARGTGENMSHVVDFVNVSTEGLESSPVAETLAGLRANEARYYSNKYSHVFTVSPAADATDALDRVTRILKDERDIVIASPALEATDFEVEGLRMTYVFYESGLSINVMYSVADGGKRAVGFKLAEGMDVPTELADRFKFARQKSKLAGVIRGSYFVIKGEY